MTTMRHGLSASVALLALGLAAAAHAQAAQTAPPVPAATPKPPPAKPAPKPRSQVSPSEARDVAEDQRDEATQVQDVTVTASRTPRPQYGAVVGDIKPELQMSPAEIQSYGVSTVTDLLNELAPQTRSDHGRSSSGPVVLLNGRRISSLSEVQNIPTEAILRIDILPEEVALKYGYTADQRVVNIVLKRFFRAVTGEASGGETTAGGDPTGQAEIDHFQVRRDVRTNFDLKYQVAGGLTDADRDLVEPSAGPPFSFAGNVVSPTGGEIDPALSALVGQPVTVAGVPAGVTAAQHLALADFATTAGLATTTDTAADHSLLPATQNLTGNVVFARPVFWGVNATVNATLTGTTSEALQGLPGASLLVPAGNPFSPFSQAVTVARYIAGAAPLRQQIDGWTGHLGLTLNKDLGSWRVSVTTAYNHADTETHTGVGLDVSALQAALNAGSPSLDPFGPLAAPPALALDTARAVTDGGNLQLLANGSLLKLPAGALYVSAKLGDVAVDARSTSRQGGLTRSQGLSRNDLQGQLNFDLPLTSKLHHILPALGELSANANLAVDDYSDFGTLPTIGYGLNWTPIPGYNLIVSETHDHLTPTVQQLDGPVLATPGVRVFDYVTGQTATLTQISGGNPSLSADDRHVLKVGLTVKPFETHDLTLTANYVDEHIKNPIETFPATNGAIEAAFPSRFVRDADGDLTLEDNRVLNFARQDRSELRWGINFTMPVGKQPPTPEELRQRFGGRRRGGGQGYRRGQGADGQPPPGGRGEDGGPPPGGPGEGRGSDGGVGPGGGPDGGAGGPGGGGFGGPPGGGGPGGGGGFGGRGFGGGGRGGRGGGFGGGPPVGGRLQFAVYHTIIFNDRFQVAPGGPVLDLLHGAAAGNGGGQPQHEVEAQFGYTNNGYGARLSADWKSGTTVSGAGALGTLSFSNISTVSLRLWDDFTQQRALMRQYPLLRGVRATFSVTNLFDQSLKVRTTSGPTPFNFLPGVLDPTGRVISINLRKIFY